MTREEFATIFDSTLEFYNRKKNKAIFEHYYGAFQRTDKMPFEVTCKTYKDENPSRFPSVPDLRNISNRVHGVIESPYDYPPVAPIPKAESVSELKRAIWAEDNPTIKKILERLYAHASKGLSMQKAIAGVLLEAKA